MKKFLSILLALAVGFTFTFGSAMSAFADTNSDAADAVKIIENLTPVYPGNASDDNGKYVNVTGYAKAIANVAVTTDGTTQYKKNAIGCYEKYAAGETIATGTAYYTVDGGYKIYTAQLDAYVAKAKDDAKNAVYVEAQKSSPDFVNNVITTASQLGQFIMDNYGDKAAYDQLVLDQADLATKAALASTANYTAEDEYPNITIDKTVYAKKSSKEIADLVLEDTVSRIKTYDLSTVSTIAAAETAKSEIDGIFNDAIDGTGAYNNPYTLKETAKYRAYNFTTLAYETKTDLDLVTLAEYAKDKADETADIAIAKGNLAKAVAATKAQSAYASNASAWDAYLDAYSTAITWLIENGKISYTNNAAIFATLPTDELVDNVYVASRYIALASSLSTNPEYTAESVKTQLESKLNTIYNSFDSAHAYKVYTGTAQTYDPKYFTANSELSATIKAAKKAAVSALVDTKIVNDIEYKAYNSTAYYDLEWTNVEAAIAAYNSAVDAAVKDADLTTAENALKAAIKAINTKADVDAYYTSGKLKKTYDAEVVKLNNYLTYLQGVAESNKDTLVVTETVDYVWYATKNARTDDEIKALYTEAQAVYDTNKTVSAWKAEAQKVVDMIAALPAKAAITTADKTAIKAAYDAYEALAADYKIYVSNYSTLNTAINAVKAKEVEAIYATAKTIPTVVTVKIADKATVQAYYDMMYEYNETEMYNLSSSDKYNLATAQGVLDRIEKLELANVTDLINALPAPIKITIADKAAIEAARAAYDAFVAEYAKDYNADVLSLANTYEATLIAAEAALKTVVDDAKWTDADVKAYVFDQATKATSVKLGAKKVKVTANFDASKLIENGYTVEYKFYKSTKKSSGYKYAVTKSADNATYTNTNAKKGKNYYKFKVVVKNADGTVILTTALKDCKYACRTIK